MVGLLVGVRVMVTVGESVGVRVGVRVGLSVAVLVWDKAQAGTAKTNPNRNRVARHRVEIIKRFPSKVEYSNVF
jgi:hypothetical protein